MNKKGDFFINKLINRSDPEVVKILLVDDCCLQQHVLSRMLIELGLDVKCASSIDEALQHITSSANINLLISDIELSNESGLDFIKLVKNKYKSVESVSSIAISSNDKYKSSALAAGFDTFLSKPILKQDFINILSQLNVKKFNEKLTKSDNGEHVYVYGS